MTPKEALDMLDRAVSTIKADRIAHVRLQGAIAVLREAIAPKTGDGEKTESRKKKK